MIKLEINGTLLSLPNKLREIPLYRVQEIYSMIKSDGEYTFNEKLVLCATVFGIEPNIFYGMEPESMDSIFNSIGFIHNQAEELFYIPTFKLNKVYYGITDLANLTVYEYMEIEDILKESESPFEHLDQMIAVLCRPISTKTKSFKNILFNILSKLRFKGVIPTILKSYKIEKYNEKHLENAEYFGRNMDAAFALAILNFYIQYKRDMQAQFPTIFQSTDIPEEDKDQYDTEPLIVQGKSFEDIWGLYHILNEVANNIFERDEWLNRNIKELFTYVTYIYAKNLNKNKITNTYG